MNTNSTARRMVAAAICAVVALAATAALAAGPGVHGRVLGHDEKGALLGVVPGAKIQFKSRSGGKVADIAADKNGYYKADLPPGEYLYEIEAEGYRKEDAGRGLRLQQSQGYAVFNLALTKGKTDPDRKPPEITPQKIGKLRGRVLEKLREQLVGIPQARIALRREGAGRLITLFSRGTSEGKHEVGDYEVTLEAGTYRASVTASGFEAFTDPDPIEIKPDEETERDFILTRVKPEESEGQGIRGVVTIVDSRGTPPPIHIQIVPLHGRDPAPIDVSSSASGAYTQELAPGRYRVIASAEGFPTATSAPAFVFSGRYTVVNLALLPERVPDLKTTVEVFVYWDPRNLEKPRPLEGAQVSLLKTGADPQTAKEGVTDATGHVIFPVTDAGEYTAEAFLKGYKPGSGKGTVELGKSHEIGIELVAEPKPPVEFALLISVTDIVTKRPLAGVRLLARHQEQSLAESARGTTDANGQASLQLTRAGKYTVLAQRLGYEPGGGNIEASARAENRLSVALRPLLPPDLPPDRLPPPPPDDIARRPVTVTGHVVYRELRGQLRAVADARLIWERLGPGRPGMRFATTGRSGTYQIELWPGTYQVRVDPPTGFERELERVEIDRATHERDFIVRRSERPPPPPPEELVNVQGVVIADEGRAARAGIAGADILFIRQEGTAKAESGTGGDFSVRLAPDRYRVHVQARGYEPLDMNADVRKGMSPLRLVLKRSEELPSGLALNVIVVERGRATTRGLTRPVADAQVQVTERGKPIASGTTDRSGQFSARVKPGSYALRVTKSGYTRADQDVAVSSRDVTQQIVLAREQEPEPTHKPTLTVHVSQRLARPPMSIRPAASPIAGAQVTVMRGAQRAASGTTDAQGTYSVQLAPGSYSVKVEAQGFAPAGKVASLADRDVSLDFQLQRREGPEPGVTPPGGIKRRPLPNLDPDRTSRGGSPGGATYVAEYRVNASSPWTAVSRAANRAEAQRAIVQGIASKRIPRTAETRIRLE